MTDILLKLLVIVVIIFILYISFSTSIVKEGLTNATTSTTTSTTSDTNGLAGNALLTGDNGISAYHSNEIGAGFSDNYSFIDNPSGGLTHSYTFIEEPGRQPNMGNGGMPQMGISSNADKQNEKETMMNKAYEELLAQRKHDLPIPIGAMRT